MKMDMEANVIITKLPLPTQLTDIMEVMEAVMEVDMVDTEDIMVKQWVS